MTQKPILILVCFSLLLGNLLIFGFAFLHSHPPTGRAQNDGLVSFCINHPPNITVPCNSTMSQNSSYFCQLLLNDSDGGNISVVQLPVGLQVFNVSDTGVINFTPNQTHVGNHTTSFLATDDSGCANNQAVASFDFSVENINDPPYLVKTIANQEFATNTSLAAFFLSDYFADPDGDALNFTSTTPSAFTVTILSTSQVIFSSNSCSADGELLTFTATDPFNASANSNALTVKVTCAQSTPSSSGGGSGGGGGGGGVSSTCKESWECDDWFPCLPTNMQWQRCVDMHGCRHEEYQKRACKYEGPALLCQENWLCKEWGKCYLNNTQYRTCEDLKQCGTVAIRPPLSQSCVYAPTCNDGIKNGNETDVDCGGPLCPACAIVQQPKPFVGTAGLSKWFLLWIILAILVLSGVAHYYRGQIAQAIAAVGFMVSHRAYKDVLIDVAERKALFERLREFELLSTSQTQTPEVLYSTLANLVRSYYIEALGVPMEAIPEEIVAKCKALGLREETTFLLSGLFSKLPLLEQEDLDVDPYFIQATIEELRTIVCLTSDYQHDELLRPVDEIAVSDKMSFYDEIFARTINVLRAVQFHQMEAARKEYLLLLTRYDPLSESEKEQVYPELRWIFDATKFQGEVVGIKIIKKPLVH